MPLFSKLFGGGAAARSAEPETYEGFRIYAEPAPEGGGYRLAARIEKEVAGELKSHRMIRADVFSDPDEARRMAVAKARILIDERGEGLFG